MDTLSHASIRKRLAKDVRSRVPDEVWRWLEKHRYISQAVERDGYVDPDAWKELVGETKSLLGLTSAKRRGRRSAIDLVQRTAQAAMGSYEEQRTLAHSEYLAALADADPRVRRFRDAIKKRADGSLVVDFAEFDRLSSDLQKQFPWQRADANRFLLHGDAPLVPAVVSRFSIQRHPSYGNHGTITIDAAAWVSAAVVTRAYSDLQHRLLGRKNDSYSARSLALLAFVTERRRHQGDNDLSWSTLFRGWNHQAPKEWRYKSIAQMRRDHWRAKQYVREPTYKTGWIGRA